MIIGSAGISIYGDTKRLRADLQAAGRAGLGLVALGSAGPALVGVAGSLSAVAAASAAIVGAIGPASGLLAGFPVAMAAVAQGALVAKFALQGVSDAAEKIGKAEGDPKKLQAAVQGLTPAAAKLATTLASIKGPIDDLRSSAQAGLFPGLDRALGDVVKAAPAFRNELKATGAAMGQLAENAADLAVARLPLIQRAAAANIPILKLAGAAGLALADAALQIGVAAQPMTTRLAAAAVGAAEFIRDAAVAGRQSGALGDFFARAYTVGAQLGRILADLGVAIFRVFSIGASTGQSLLDTLETGAQRFRDFTESAQGVRQIGKYFADGRTNLIAFVGLARAVGEELGSLGSGAALAPFLDQISNELVPAIGDLFQAAADSGAIETLISAVSDLVGVLANVSGEGSALQGFAAVIRGLADAAVYVVDNVPGAAKAFGVLALGLGGLAALNLVGLGGAVASLAGAVLGLGFPVLAVGAALVIAYTQFEGFRNVVNSVAASIAATFLPVLTAVGGFIRDNLTPILAGLGAAFAIGGIIAFVGALASIVGVIASVVGFVSTLIGILGAAGAASTLLAAAIATIGGPVTLVVAAIALLVAGVVYAYQNFEGFRLVVQTVVAYLQTNVLPVLQQVADYFRTKFGEAVAYVKAIMPQAEEAVGHALNAIKATVQAVLTVVTALWSVFGSSVLRILGGSFTALSGVVLGALQAVRGVVEGTLLIIGGVIRTVLAVINGDWSGAWNGIKQILSGVMTIIRGTVGGAMTAISGLVRGGLQIVLGYVQGVGAGISAAFRAAWNAAKAAVAAGVQGVIGLVRALPGQIRGALGDVGGILSAAGAAIIDGLAAGIRAGAGRVTEAVRGVLAAARNLLPFSPAKEGPFSGKGWTLYSGQSLVQGLADGVSSKQSAAVGAVGAVALAMRAKLDTSLKPFQALGGQALGRDLSNALLGITPQLTAAQTATAKVAQLMTEAVGAARQRRTELVQSVKDSNGKIRDYDVRLGKNKRDLDAAEDALDRAKTAQQRTAANNRIANLKEQRTKIRAERRGEVRDARDAQDEIDAIAGSSVMSAKTRAKVRALFTSTGQTLIGLAKYNAGLADRVRKEGAQKVLDALAADRVELAKQIDAATSALQAAIAKRDQFASQITANAVSFGSLLNATVDEDQVRALSSTVQTLTSEVSTAQAAATQTAVDATAAQQDLTAALGAYTRYAGGRGFVAAQTQAAALTQALASAQTRMNEAVTAYGPLSGQAVQASVAYAQAQQNISNAVSRNGSSFRTVIEATSKLTAAQLANAAANDKVTTSSTALATATDSLTKASVLGSDRIIATMKARLNALTTYRTQLQQLAALGLNDTSFQQLAEAGAEGGSQFATALLAGGAAAVAQVNTLQGQINDAAKGLGTDTAGHLYDAGIATAQGFLEGLQAKDSEIAAQMQHIADALVASVRSALGIRSPSTVMRDLGRQTGRGFSLGLADMADDAKANAIDLAAAAQAGATATLRGLDVTGSRRVLPSGNTYAVTLNAVPGLPVEQQIVNGIRMVDVLHGQT